MSRFALGKLADLRKERLMVDGPDDDPLLIVRHAGVVYVVDAMCPHQYAPLIGGDVEDHVVICPMHGWRFDLRSGEMPGNPWCRLGTHGVEVEDGVVYLVQPT